MNVGSFLEAAGLLLTLLALTSSIVWFFVRLEMKAQTSEFKAEIQSKTSEFKLEMRSEFNNFKTEVRDDVREAVKEEIDNRIIPALKIFENSLNTRIDSMIKSIDQLYSITIAVNERQNNEAARIDAQSSRIDFISNKLAGQTENQKQ